VRASFGTGPGLAVAALVVAASACAPRVAPALPSPVDGGEVRLLTYNVNFGLAGDPETLAAIRDAGADLVLLQETNPGWERALRAALSSRYPHMSFRHEGGAGGLAVLSRLPVQLWEVYPPTGDGWFPAGRVVVQAPFGPLQALNVHLRPPVSDGGSFVSGYFATPRVRAAEIADHVRRLDPALPTVIAGDFNEEPDERVTTFLAARGYLSALARLAPGAPTWRWDTAVGTLRRQLDHVVHDRRVLAVAVTVMAAGRSDHLPVLAVLRPAAPP
jgi:endonuclease/exonuclease/phosphatase (EEP) superfamily protein YafD